MPQRLPLLLFSIVLTVVAVSRPAQANDGEDRVQFGRNILVTEDENVGDLVCIGCSIRVDGISHDTVAIGGSVVVNGTVKGDMAVIGGSADLRGKATVEGDVATVGGRVNRDPDSNIRGEVSTRSGLPIFLGLVLVPLIPILLIVGLILWLVKPNRRQPPVRAWQPPPTA